MVHVSAKFWDINAFSTYSAKTKSDERMDGQTDRRGALLYLPSRASGAVGDNKHIIP